MKHEAGVRERGRGIADSVMTGFLGMGAAHGRCVRPCRPWGMALVLLVVAACGGGGGSGSSNSSNDTDDTATVESVSLDRETLLLETGDSASITATLHLSNGGTASGESDVNWFVGSSSFASIAEETGTTATVKGGEEVGRTTVTAESGGHRATADVFVAKEVALQVRPSTIFLSPECSEPVTARLITDQGVTQNVTRDVTWSVSNSDAITVASGSSNAGLIEARTPSTVPVESVVSASYRTRRATGRVTVAGLGSIALVEAGTGIDVTGTTIDLAQDEPRRLKAIGSFTQDTGFPAFPDRAVSDCVEWKSSDEDVAMVTDYGVVIGVTPGKTEVSVSYGSEPSENEKVTISVANSMTGFSIKASDPVELIQGARQQLQAVADIDDGTFAGTTSDITTAVDWKSDSPEFATVGNETGSRGLVTGVAPGQAVVTAALSGANEDSVVVEVTSSRGAPGGLSVRANPNVLLAGDDEDPSDICTLLISSGLPEPISDTVIEFSIDEGGSNAELVDKEDLTDDGGEACVDLAPIDGSGAGSVIVRSEEPDSGLADTVNVGLVNSLADVFDTSGDVDSPISDGTVSSGTIFQATLVNGSNRGFSVDVDSLAFCSKDGEIDVSTQGPENDQVPGGGEVVVSVETNNDHTSDGFAIALRLYDDDPGGDPFAIEHQFTDTAVACDPN